MKDTAAARNQPIIRVVTSWQFPHVGGVSSHLSLLAKSLAIDESEVISARQVQGNASSGRALLNAVERRLRSAFRIETFSLPSRAMIRVLSGVSADVVHCHDVMAAWSACVARVKYGKRYKVLATVHGPMSRHMREEGYHEDSSDLRKVIECELETWQAVDAIIAVDTRQAEIVCEQKANPEKVVVIPNAVDTELVEKTATALPLENSPEQPFLVVPRRLAPKNGVRFAISALALIPPQRRPKLLLAGDGPERQELEALASRLGVAKEVLFLGAVPHALLMPLVRLSRSVIIPSVPVHGVEEATSIAALEAMALGKLVIASGIGGLRELVTHEADGWLVPPGDAHALATAIERSLIDSELAARLGQAAKATTKQRFSVDLWSERHNAVYNKLAAVA